MNNNDNSLSGIIRAKLLADFRGKRNAKNRHELLKYIHQTEPTVTDRDMREIYNRILLIGWCDEGIYVIESIPEVEKAIRTRKRTIKSHEENVKQLQRYRQYLIDQKRGQRRLFASEEQPVQQWQGHLFISDEQTVHAG